MVSSPSTKRPIATLLQQELRRVLVALGALLALSLGVFSFAVVRSDAQAAAELMLNQALTLSKAASNSGNLLSLDRDLNRFLTSWQTSQSLRARVQILIDSRLVASAGPNAPISGLRHESQIQLPLSSGSKLTVQVQIGKHQALAHAFLVLLLLEALLACAFWMLNRRLTHSLIRLTSPLEQTASWLMKAAGELPKSARLAPPRDGHDILEVASLLDSVRVLLAAIDRYDEELSRAKLDQARVEVAEQVSHDIRSPLTTLEVSLSRADGLSPTDRALLQSVAARIREITNSLQGRPEFSEAATQATRPEASGLEPQFLQPILEDIATQKRAQYQSAARLTIEADHASESYGLFARLQPSELARALSNLIDNAVEACGEGGRIQISAAASGGQVEIRVSDNGHGIPEDLLPRLGERGQTFGKPNGSGLGLHSAKSCVESWGGQLLISSRLGVGTQVSLSLPREPAPAWLAPAVPVPSGGTLVVVDDDPTIRLLWKYRYGKLVSAISPNPAFELVTLESPDALRAWIQNHADLTSQSCFLMDYDFGPGQANGLELIEQLGIEQQSALVTSRYADPEIAAWCYLLRVPQIPKDSLGFVPVRVLSHPEHIAACAETHSVAIGG